MFLRFLRKEDTPTAKKLWGYAFETDEPFYSWYFDEVFSPNHSLGIFEEDQLISYLQLNPYTLSLNHSLFETSYVVGVITSPEYRNKGTMKFLIPKAIEEMRNKNHFVSILMPFDTTFYQPYGWELSYSQKKYQIPMSIIGHFSQREKKYYFNEINLDDDFENLNNIYESFLNEYHGYMKRNKKNWDFILKDLIYYGGYAFILKNEQKKPIGYILYFIKDKKFIVREMSYENYTAKKALFSFIYSHISQATHVEWSAPLDESTHLFLKDTIQPEPTNQIGIYPFMCARVIDVKAAIEHCTFHQNIDTKFSIEIKDPYAPWNEGIFMVHIENQKANVQKDNHIKADLSCSINTFSQLFFGAIDINTAIFMENIKVYNPEAIKNFSKVFYQKKNYINEYF
ncbi:GNAT family N-acetyltransferase [Inediibacterium massiliense]|uniref:GNAT family N-acetyltransferase n=1 Tax=Inediibacterium massiliense TaxID=1658111 RepID=UPI0006B4DFFF|nr:GNAT family N-acetyltransferase [Inediibacterium massiliense]